MLFRPGLAGGGTSDGEGSRVDTQIGHSGKKPPRTCRHRKHICGNCILTHDEVESRPLLAGILDDAGNPLSDHAPVTHCPAARGVRRDCHRVRVELEAHVTV
jgi:hypothetical protein